MAERSKARGAKPCLCCKAEVAGSNPAQCCIFRTLTDNTRGVGDAICCAINNDYPKCAAIRPGLISEFFL